MAERNLELCTICGSHKRLHNHQNHQWTNEEDPDVIPVPGAKMGSEDRSTPPRKRESPLTADAHASRTIVRLIEVLTVKNLLTAEELKFIFGGRTDDASSADRPTDGHPRPAGEEDGS